MADYMCSFVDIGLGRCPSTPVALLITWFTSMAVVAEMGLSHSMSRERVMAAIRERFGDLREECLLTMLNDLPKESVLEYLVEAFQDLVGGDMTKEGDAWKGHITLMLSLWDELDGRCFGDPAWQCWREETVGRNSDRSRGASGP